VIFLFQSHVLCGSGWELISNARTWVGLSVGVAVVVWCRGDFGSYIPHVDRCRVDVGVMVPPLYAFMDIT
jgi:hypothetical protein